MASDFAIRHAVHIINQHEGILINDGEQAMDNAIVEQVTSLKANAITDLCNRTSKTVESCLSYLNKTQKTSYQALPDLSNEHAEILLHNLKERKAKIEAKQQEHAA